MQLLIINVQDQGHSQKFLSEGDKTGGLGTEVPQRGPGAEPWWGSGSPQKLKTYMLTTIAIMC